MIDFKITFQADELLYGDNKRMSLISESCSENFRQFYIKNDNFTS